MDIGNLGGCISRSRSNKKIQLVRTKWYVLFVIFYFRFICDVVLFIGVAENRLTWDQVQTKWITINNGFTFSKGSTYTVNIVKIGSAPNTLTDSQKPGFIQRQARDSQSQQYWLF